MIGEELEFGAFIRKKRLENGVTLRKMAQIMEYSPTYWSDIENGHRNPPGVEKLNLICEQLQFEPAERDHLFDLAGDFNKAAPPDLTNYLQDPDVRRALRTAKSHNATSEMWKDFENSVIKGKSK